MLTRVFKSGNSLAVRIPKELGFSEPNEDVEIERQGNALIIRPVEKRSLAGLMDKFAAFPRDFMAEGLEFHEENERDW
jgi:antitoxin VapB